ncbi:MAG: GerMN domain-containing protein [Acidimicrobiales bacterium]
MKRRCSPSTLRLVARIAALSIVLAACGVGTEENPTVLAEGDQPFVLAGPSDDGTDEATTEYAVYLVRDERLVGVSRELSSDAGAAGTVRSLLDGPTDAEASEGLSTAIPSSTLLTAVAVDGSTATVDLTSSFTAVGGVEEILAVGQVVLTLCEFPTIDDVAFVLDGRAVAVPTGDGALTERPVTAEDYAELLDR